MKNLILFTLITITFNCATLDKTFESKEKSICRSYLDNLSGNVFDKNKIDDLYKEYAEAIYPACTYKKFQEHPAFANIVTPTLNELIKVSTTSITEFKKEKDQFDLSIAKDKELLEKEEKAVNAKEKEKKLTEIGTAINKVEQEISTKKDKIKSEIESRKNEIIDELKTLELKANNNCILSSDEIYWVSKQFIRFQGSGSCGEKDFSGKLILSWPRAKDLPAGIDLDSYKKAYIKSFINNSGVDTTGVKVNTSDAYYEGYIANTNENTFTTKEPKN